MKVRTGSLAQGRSLQPRQWGSDFGRRGGYPVVTLSASSTAAARARSVSVPSPSGPGNSVHSGKAGLTLSAERTAQLGSCDATCAQWQRRLPAQVGQHRAMVQAAVPPVRATLMEVRLLMPEFPAKSFWLLLRGSALTGICGLTSRERPRSVLQRSPSWPPWLLFRPWRRRWSPRLPGCRAWRDAWGQPRRSCPTVRRWLWSSGTSWRANGPCWGPCCRSRGDWRTLRTCCATGTSGSCSIVGYFSVQRGSGLEDLQKELCKHFVKGSCETLGSGLGHHQARTPSPSGERRPAGNCSLPSVERGQTLGTAFPDFSRRELCLAPGLGLTPRSCF
uniref:uncharacterized protein LOC118143582 n=1 Tax=Callithrix jacchus TaxID=9483 RepID=UPI0023DD23E5|nr:uncharacterized protein LOC118143582 [Callithrix jacchus]